MLSVLVLPVFSQSKLKKITVLPLKDRTGSRSNTNISEKAADALLSKLAETGKFVVVERESLALLQSEKNLKFDGDFNPTNAPKSGMMAVCDFLVTGQIDEFSVSERSVDSGNYISKNTQIEGTTALRLTVRVTSVETGQIIAAPSARVEKSGVLGRSPNSTMPGSDTSKTSTADANSALQKLVDSEIEDISTQLAARIAASLVASGGAAPAVSVPPKFVGIENGLAVINKGSITGIKVGDSFDVVRPTDTGMTDPDGPQRHIIRRKRICTIVISSVEENLSEGTCEGGIPQNGDEIRMVTK
jgi:curli biogenesis system outer membrane secretion channel CsgG